MNPDERPTKRDAFNAFFGEGWVSIHLDARRDGVKVPDEHTSNRHLVLQYGQNMPIPIPDLRVDDQGITATLSFSRTPHRTFVPWTAVYIVACNDGRGILYYEDVPEDVSFFTRPLDAKTGDPTGAVLDAESRIGGPSEDEGDTEVEQLDNDGEAAESPPAKRKRAVKRERLLKSVPAEPPSNEPEGEEATASTTRRRKRPQLRVVK